MNRKQLIGMMTTWKMIPVAIAILVSFLGSTASAQTWYGTVSTSWNNPTNWTPSWQIPQSIQSVPSAGASITIPSGCPYYPLITNSVTIGSFTMNQGSGSFTVSNGTVTASSIALGSGSTFTIASGGNVTASGGITAGGNWTVNGTLTGSLTFYNTGTFVINSGGTLNTSSGGINLNSGGGTFTIYGTLNDGANAINDNCSVLLSGGTLICGAYTFNNATLTVVNGTMNAAGGFTFYNGGNFNVSGASTVTTTGSWAYDGGSWNISSGNFIFSGGSMTLPSGSFTSVTLAGSGTYSMPSGTSISGNLSIASGVVDSIASGVNVNVGSLTLANAGQANGTWGYSGENHNNTTYFANTSGYLTVSTNTATQSTTTTLASLPATTYGNSVTFNATVSPSAATGTVQFLTNGVAIGSPVTIASGKAAYSTSALVPGTYTITASYNGNAVYTASTSASGSQVVNKASVTITSGLAVNSKVYDSTTTATISLNSVVLSGVLAGDAANVSLSTSGYTATFAKATIGSNIGVTVSGLTLTGSAAAYYTFSQPTGLTASITSAPVYITSGITASNKVYNGNTVATIISNNVTLSGIVANDTANVKLSTAGYTATFASATVGNNIGVTVSGLSLTGSAAANYTLTQPTGLSANITPASVTIASGVTASNKVYDATTTATLIFKNVSLSGVVSADSANVKLATNSYTATFATATPGTGITVTVNGLSLTGSAAGNYTFTQPTLTANITAMPVTIVSGITANNKVYDGTSAATISLNNVVLSGVLSGDLANVSLSTNGYAANFASASAGNNINVTVSGLTLTGSAAASYTLAQPTGLQANITKMTVAITSPNDGSTIVTNNTTETITGTFTGNAVVTNVTVTLNGSMVTNATTANGWTNWSAILPVTAGASTVTAYATDIAGNYSATNTIAFTIVHTGTLTVLTNGLGSVSPNMNGLTLKIGQNYSMAASGKNGWSFTTWTSNVLPATNTANLNFIMASNLVLTANFANTTKPTVQVITPTANAQFVTNAQTLTVAGTATGNAAGNVAVIGVWLSLDGVNWTNATTANNWTNWNTVLPVSAGAHTLYVYAEDATGNYSSTNVVAFTFIHTGPLFVSTTGSGTVSPNDNGAILQIGQPYSLTATPASNWRFTNWTSNLLPTTNTAHLNFNMASNLTLTANFAYAVAPLLTITALTNGEVVITNSTITTVKGTALSKVPIANVWVSISGSAWTNATTANSWTNWTAVLPVTTGPQVLQAYAVDMYGNHSATNTIRFDIVHTGLMTVRTNGNGTIWPNYDTLKLQIGGVYTMLATGREGWSFLSWTSNQQLTNNGIVTNNPTISFQMTSNLVLTANFVDLSKPTVTIPLLAAGQHSITNQSPLTVNGTTIEAPDSSPITGVWVSFNGNAWQNVTTTNNWANWSAVMTPTVGTQSVRAYAVDSIGNYSTTTEVDFAYVQTYPVYVETNQFGTGLGTITPNYNGQYLQPGTVYIMKAQSLPGCVLSNWTCNVLPPTNTATLFFRMQSNSMTWYANFIDIQRPTIAVTNTTNGRLVTSNPYNLMGTAADNVAVGSIRYSVNSNAWQYATGTTNWLASVALNPGTNNIRVWSVDTALNNSLTNTVTVQYAVPAVLTLQTNGVGAISGATGPFFIGQHYSLTAVAGANFTFTNWTGNYVAGTNRTTIQFTMVSNLVLTANFVDSKSPTVVIVSPISSRVTNNAVTVTGTAADNLGLTGVYCSVNGGSWTLTSSANNYTNWTTSLTLAPGTNIIRAYALGQSVNNLNRYSPTSSVTVYFLTAPYNLLNFRAVVTPTDGSPAFVMDFGSTAYSEFGWGTNGDAAAGTYTYTNPGLASGVISLQSFALPGNTYSQTVQLNFTNRYAAWFTYTNDAGQTIAASAVFSVFTNIAPTTLVGQKLARVDATGTSHTYSFISATQMVNITGAAQQTNSYSYQVYGPGSIVLTTSIGTETNWTLIHFVDIYAGEYYSENTTGAVDYGLTGFIRTTTGGNAPTAAGWDASLILANNGSTLTTVAFGSGLFSLTTSDDSATGAGTYLYTPLTSNSAQLNLDYTTPASTPSVSNTIQFLNPNFGIATNNATLSGVVVY